jgi:hypothetical protein
MWAFFRVRLPIRDPVLTGYGISGVKQSKGACIEYVSGSQVCHSIRQVSYKADDMLLRYKDPKLLVKLTFEEAVERVAGRQVGLDRWRIATCSSRRASPSSGALD